MSTPREPLVDFVMPVHNEGANIERAIAEIYDSVPFPKRVLVVYDFDDDDSLPVVRRVAEQFDGIELVRNLIGHGALGAMQTGIEVARADVVIITMADLSDAIRIVARMVSLIRDEGFDVVCASRYMRGGRQIGGPLVKGFLSRVAGVSLHWLSGIPTHDATNSFRAYRRTLLDDIVIESSGGFELALELTAKAYVSGARITEVPSVWQDRRAGASRFKLVAWLPQYLRWYWYTVRHRPLGVRTSQRHSP